MSLIGIDDLNQSPEEVEKYVQLAKSLSTGYDNFASDAADGKDRAPGIHASELYPCLRKAVYSQMGIERRPRLSKFWRQRFQMGKAIHSMLQADFHAMAKRTKLGDAKLYAGEFARARGYTMEFQDEIPVSPEKQDLARFYNLHSACDGVFTFRNRSTGEVELRVGLEIKSEAPKGFEDLKEPKAEHVRQGHIYMAALDLPLMWFLYVNKGNQNNTNSRAPYLVVFNSAIWQEVEARCRTVLELAAQKELPPGTEGILCEFCPWSYTCNPTSMGQSRQPSYQPTLRKPRTP